MAHDSTKPYKSKTGKLVTPKKSKKSAHKSAHKSSHRKR